MDDFSGLEYDQESVSEGDVISKTNSLLSQFNLPTQVTSIHEISASLFVVLYESLFSDRLPGIVRQPVTKEDEIHNCQMVIDVLSADVIKDNLSHIRGVDIVEGKVQSINNLLDIFTFLYEYVIKQIESDVPTDAEDDTRSLDWQEGVERNTDTLDLVPSVDRLETLQQQNEAKESDRNGGESSPEIDANGLGRGALKGASKMPVPAARSRGRAANGAIPSPIRPDNTTSLRGNGTLDSTEELIREGEQLDKDLLTSIGQAGTKTAWSQQGGDGNVGQFDYIGVRPAPAVSSSGGMLPGANREDQEEGASHLLSAASGGDAYLDSAINRHPVATTQASQPSAHVPSHKTWSATAPPQHQKQALGPRENLRSTVGPVTYHSRQTPEKPYQQSDVHVKGLSSSYEDLHHMVQQTAALTRAALDTSPMRSRHDGAARLDITDLSQERHQVPAEEALTLAQELNLDSPARLFSRSYPTDEAKRVERQVEFHRERSLKEPFTDVPKDKVRIPPNTDYRPQSSRPQSSRPGVRAGARVLDEVQEQPPRHAASSRILEQEKRKADKTARDRLVERVYRTPQSPGSEGEEGVTGRREAHGDGMHSQAKGQRLSSRLHNMGRVSLADTQRHLEVEDRTYQRRQDCLKKLYAEDFDDVLDEVKNLVGKDRKLMKSMEDEYRKLMMIAAGKPVKKKAASKPASKPKGVLLPPSKKSKPRPQSGSKGKASSVEESTKAYERPLSIGDNDELMPVLLEEFPHLYLSEHTWHELWRRGITQIENLTQAYEENKRRKSRAQVQLEEAARKHEVLAAAIKKQLGHSQRLNQLKEQKKQQVMVHNKLHEKRLQSARARRYYNEYQVRARSKVLKRRSKEEQIFKNIFKDGLAIQKERIQEVRRYAKEQRDKQAKKRQDEIDSLENYYRDQFELLVGRLLTDRQDMASREHEHEKVLHRMKRDLRQKMEKEIQNIQKEMFRDEDDTYFRQLEADRLRQELHLAKYQTRV